MFDAQHVHGFDIETDNSEGHGLNPARSKVTQVAIATAWRQEVIECGDERELLPRVTRRLLDLPAGLLVTWNGTFFDMPFIQDRASALGVLPGLGEWQMAAQPGLVPKYDYLPGHRSGYDVRWAGHVHLDISFAWRSFAERVGVPWSLKPVARAVGLAPVEIDRTRLHTYSQEDVHAYVASDARVARELALITLGLASAPRCPGLAAGE